MKVLFLSPDFVLPPNRGLRVRELSQLQLLASLQEVEHIRFLSLSAAPVTPELLRDLEAKVPKLQADAPSVRDVSVRQSASSLARFFNRRVIRREPYLFAVHDVPRMHRMIELCLEANRFDIIYVGYLGLMAYSSLIAKLAPNASILLEQHNIEWRIFESVAEDAKRFKRQIVQFEARSLKNAEHAALRSVDSIIAISDVDAEYFREVSDTPVTVVRPFVRCPTQRVELGTENSFGYIGHLAWQPNVYGLNWFCSEVWPNVLDQLPNATLTIAGPGLPKNASGKMLVPDAWVRRGIDVVGFVDDLEALYRKTFAIVAPVVGGSGVRMKLLETLGAGVPTITTPDGAAGLCLTHERDVLIAENAQDFAEGAIRLATNPGLRQSLRMGGYKYLESFHTMSAAAEQLRTALRLAVERRNMRQQA